MKRKRGETSVNLLDDTTDPASCPSYGSQEYWEQRYKGDSNGNEKECSSKTDEGESGFSWYFNYEELKPLLLPLCIGRNDDDDWSNVDEEEDFFEEKSYEVEEENEKMSNGEEDTRSKTSQNSKKETLINDIGAKDDEKEVNGNKDAIGQELPEEVKETEVSEDEEDEEFPISLETFCTDQSYVPRSVLEIGCGDVPLGLNLCTNLLEIQEKTGINAKRAVERIVCFDYSNIAIDMLIKQQKKSREKDKDSLKENILQVEYEVHDARALPYKDAEFHVVTDKGTLDAMLSDKETGKKSCIKIISEASRVLAVDGYFLIVSHLNVNSAEGLNWAQEVLLPGLRDGDNVCDWRIEVHSRDVDDGDEDTNKIVDSSDDSCNKVDNTINSGDNVENSEEEEHHGPAVYIIRKMDVSEEERQRRKTTHDTSTADMKFFAY